MIKFKIWFPFVILFLAGFGLMSACGEQKEPVTTKPPPVVEQQPERATPQPPVSPDEVKREIVEAVEAARIYAEQQQQEYQKRLDAELQEFGRQIDEFKSTAEDSGALAKEQLERQIEALEKERQKLLKELEQIQAETERAWEEFMAELQAITNEKE